MYLAPTIPSSPSCSSARSFPHAHHLLVVLESPDIVLGLVST
jgi:hypothetical protein